MSQDLKIPLNLTERLRFFFEEWMEFYLAGFKRVRGILPRNINLSNVGVFSVLLSLSCSVFLVHGY